MQETTITRRLRFRTSDEKQVTVLTKTTKNNHYNDDMYSIAYYNCIYITFIKEDFPNLNYPKLIEGFSKGTKRFDYGNSDIATLDWHVGITYYKEELNIESDKVVVTAGADYQHDCDTCYMKADNGESILERNGEKLFNEFKEL